jgi:predicted nucleotidyltransferase
MPGLPTITLPESFLPSLITELKTPNVTGITMAGSFSRGQAGSYSDIDLQLYVKEKPRELIGSLALRLWQGFLVSIHYDSIEEERAKLTSPWDAIWAVPGLRQAVILYDPTGSLADLKQAAVEFDWSPLQPLADRFASSEIAGYAEEVYKILSGLSIENESKVLYANIGLILGMAKTVAVQRGILIETENRYFELIQDSVGRDSKWTRLFRLALGADTSSEKTPPYRICGIAALGLYRQTAELMDSIILEGHREVIISTLNLISAAGY